MKLLVFIGGVQGVGKTTVMEKSQQLDPTLAIFDPGRIFELYHLEQKVVEPKVLEEMVVLGLTGLSQEKTLINWHYGVWYGRRYIPHISWKLLEQVARRLGASTEILFVLLTADLDLVLQRRQADAEKGLKKRPLSRKTINYELRTEKRFFQEHLQLFERNKVVALVIDNHDSQQTAQQLKIAIQVLSAKE